MTEVPFTDRDESENPPLRRLRRHGTSRTLAIMNMVLYHQGDWAVRYLTKDTRR